MSDTSNLLLLGIFLIVCIGQGFQIALLSLIVKQSRDTKG